MSDTSKDVSIDHLSVWIKTFTFAHGKDGLEEGCRDRDVLKESFSDGLEEGGNDGCRDKEGCSDGLK